MTIAIATIGLLVFALGVVGLVQPASLLGLVERPWRSRAELYGAIAFRAAFGILLVTAASGTHFPRTLGALGLLSLVSAALIPLLGFDRMRRFIDWWLARAPRRRPHLVLCGMRVWRLPGVRRRLIWPRSDRHDMPKKELPDGTAHHPDHARRCGPGAFDRVLPRRPRPPPARRTRWNRVLRDLGNPALPVSSQGARRRRPGLRGGLRLPRLHARPQRPQHRGRGSQTSGSRCGWSNPREARAKGVLGGYSGYFQDPDGFLWEVAWNPHLPL